MTHSNALSVLVYDVGGSHVSAAICEQGSYALAGISRAHLPADGDIAPASFGRLIRALGDSAARGAGVSTDLIAGASLAMPGPFDYQRGVSHMHHKFPGLFGFDLKSALAARFHWQPNQIRFVNDAAAFLLGEAGAGAARGYARLIGITLGTGIGCAFAIAGPDGPRIAPSNPSNAEGVPPGGEIWNLPYNGATVEDFVSTRFLRSQYLSLTGVEAEVAMIADAAAGDQPCPEPDENPATQPHPAVLNPNADSKVDPDDPYAAHCRARQAFERFGRHLGLALNQHVRAFRPDVIVFGGGISRAAHLFLPATRKALAGFSPVLAISTLMDEANLAGAAVDWFNTAV